MPEEEIVRFMIRFKKVKKAGLLLLFDVFVFNVDLDNKSRNVGAWWRLTKLRDHPRKKVDLSMTRNSVFLHPRAFVKHASRTTNVAVILASSSLRDRSTISTLLAQSSRSCSVYVINAENYAHHRLK